MQGKLSLFVAGLLMSGSAMAAQGDWLIRGRVIDVAPDVSTSGALSTLNVDVDNKAAPELDFTYMLTDKLGAELILGTARHTVTAGGASLGKVSHLPPTLTLQYHFAPDTNIRPYVGAGINYTRFYNVDLHAGAVPLDVDKNSFGGALQAGVDIAVNKDWFVNLDVKKLYIKTDVNVRGGASLGTLKINPVVWGVGVGTHF
ncbi:OmpW/AlkL family protein [Chitinimonas sp.]|uniref:OmpW/AlkL family protein n=1 Tax=Chitinimonas sp. TaxID=1934313 RepID=UPI002F92CBCD